MECPLAPSTHEEGDWSMELASIKSKGSLEFDYESDSVERFPTQAQHLELGSGADFDALPTNDRSRLKSLGSL